MSDPAKEAYYEIYEDTVMGSSALRVFLTDKPFLYADTYVTLYIDYKTTSASKAINWLNAEQTADKKLGYMFTEC